MQAQGLNALIALVSGNAAGGRADSADRANADDSHDDQQFAQLLNDSGTQPDGQGAQFAARGQTGQNSSGNLLSAQEIDGMKAGVNRQLLPLGDQQVTPEDAADIIKKIDDLLAQQQDGAKQQNASSDHQEIADMGAGAQTQHASDADAMASLKEQLQAIVVSGTPKSLGEIINALPAVKQSKQAWAMLGSLFVAKPTSKPPVEEASTQANATAPLVPATVFRAARRDDAAAATAALETVDKKKTRDYVDTASFVAQHAAPVPAATNVAPAAMPVAANADDTVAAAPMDTIRATPSVTDATPPATLEERLALAANAKPLPTFGHDDSDAITASPLSVRAGNGLMPVRADLDDAIPPLALSDAEKLPQIDLPEAAPAQTAASDKTALTKDQQTLNSALAPQTVADAAKDAGAASAADKKVAANDVASTLNPSNIAGHSPTQTAHAVQPISVASAASVAHGSVNHAPVSDQVHVAISKAAKDGIDRITIQLDPIDMGRVEVQMHTTKDGQTHVSFLVDKPETFDNLSRDARTLERSLHEAGIKADTGSMQFNLRQQSQQQQLHSDAGGQGQFQQGQARTKPEEHASTTNGTTPVAALTKNYTINVRDGVDISA